MRKFRKGFPKISLSDALAKAEQVYKKEFNHPAPRTVIAVDMGYSGLNGASSNTLSALSIYGLLEPVGGDEYKVSDDARNYFLHDRGETERVESIRTLAFNPQIFAELNDKFGGSASDKNIEAYLIKNDYHPESTRTIIQAYRDTMQFVESEIGKPLAHSGLGDSNELRPETVAETRPAETSTPINAEPSDALTGETLVFKISKNSSVHISFSGPVTQESIDKLVKLLEVSKDTFPMESEIPLTDPA